MPATRNITIDTVTPSAPSITGGPAEGSTATDDPTFTFRGEVVHDFIGVRMFAVGVDELAAYTGLSEEELREQYGLPGNGAIVSEVRAVGPAANPRRKPASSAAQQPELTTISLKEKVD
jgi:hypothetical protein